MKMKTKMRINKDNLVKYNERNESRINQSISGAIFKINLEKTAPDRLRI